MVQWLLLNEQIAALPVQVMSRRMTSLSVQQSRKSYKQWARSKLEVVTESQLSVGAIQLLSFPFSTYLHFLLAVQHCIELSLAEGAWTSIYLFRAASRNTWAVTGWKMSIIIWIQSQREEQKSSVLSDQLNYKMLKGYNGIFARWHQK